MVEEKAIESEKNLKKMARIWLHVARKYSRKIHEMRHLSVS